MSKKANKWPPDLGCGDETTASASMAINITVGFDMAVEEIGQSSVQREMTENNLSTRRDFDRHYYGSLEEMNRLISKRASGKHKQELSLPESKPKLNDMQIAELTEEYKKMSEVRLKLKQKRFNEDLLRRLKCHCKEKFGIDISARQLRTYLKDDLIK